MKAVKKGKREAKKVAKNVSRRATKLGKKVAKGTKGLETKWKKEQAKWQKMIAGKDEVIAKLKGQIAETQKAIRETKKGLLDRAKESLLEWKGKAETEGQKLKAELEAKGKALLELKNRAEVEYTKVKEELGKKTQALGDKVKELEDYRKVAEKKLAELQTKAKEFVGKVIPGERERTGLVTFKGNPMTLLGAEIRVGDKAPDFQVVDNALQKTTLDSFRGKIKVLTSVPSLDTPVCDMETRRFNEEAGKLPDNAVVLTVSMDLPFAQKRWCAAAGVEKVMTFSDYQLHSFGLSYGVLLKELQLLARAVFIVDDQDVVRYIEIVPEITKEPDYDRVLNAVRALL
jgi:thiol peroxidase